MAVVNPPYGHNRDTHAIPGWNVRESTFAPNTDPTGRVDLQPTKFDQLLDQKGMNMKIFRTMYCPNVKSADGAEHELDCTLCNSSGYIDVFPLITRGFIQNQDLQKLDGPAGQFDGNTVLMTFPIGVELQYFTLIELCDKTDLYFQRVMRATGTPTDNLKYRCCRVNAVVDSLGVFYYEAADFKIDQNGNIQWLTAATARKPADFTIYSIHYEMHVQYRAVKAMHVSRFTQSNTTEGVEFIKMPEQWMCTKEFLLRKRDINTRQDLPEGPFENHTNTTGDNG